MAKDARCGYRTIWIVPLSQRLSHGFSDASNHFYFACKSIQNGQINTDTTKLAIKCVRGKENRNVMGQISCGCCYYFIFKENELKVFSFQRNHYYNPNTGLEKNFIVDLDSILFECLISKVFVILFWILLRVFFFWKNNTFFKYFFCFYWFFFHDYIEIIQSEVC